MSTISDLAKRTVKTITDNSPAILTGLGAAGVVSTAYLASRGGFRAAGLIYEYENKENGLWVKMSPREMIDLTWKQFIPAAAVGAVSVVCIISANSISSRRNAALISVYTLTESAFKEYKEKVVEQIGTNKEKQVRDSVAQDTVNAHPLTEANMIVMTNGDVLCFDKHTGRYFSSNMEKIRKVENDVNYELLNGDGNVSLNEFYHKVGLESVATGEDLGWNSDDKFELSYSATIRQQDNQPCIVIEFKKGPRPNFYKLW